MRTWGGSNSSWECLKCGTVWAPFVQKCTDCGTQGNMPPGSFEVLSDTCDHVWGPSRTDGTKFCVKCETQKVEREQPGNTCGGSSTCSHQWMTSSCGGDSCVDCGARRASGAVEDTQCVHMWGGHNGMFCFSCGKQRVEQEQPTTTGGNND